MATPPRSVESWSNLKFACEPGFIDLEFGRQAIFCVPHASFIALIVSNRP
jgi:hypothetical protein